MHMWLQLKFGYDQMLIFFNFEFILNCVCVSLSEIIKVYDGNGSFRRHIFRLICVSRQSTTEELLTAALREFRITKDLGKFC
jgi:hypothetical protein